MSDENKQENTNQQPSLETKPPQTSSLNDSSPEDETKAVQETGNLDRKQEPLADPKSAQTNPLSDSSTESAEKDSDKASVKFDDVKTKPHHDDSFDPTKQTAVLSRDNPLLRRALNNRSDDNQFQGTTTLGEKREVILLIRGMAERVVMQEGIIYKLGRFELGMAAPNEIDLTPYGAMDRGVSRVHAQLHLEDDHLYITDLSSTNGTYVSGNKVEPDTPTALRKGDELLLGRLQVQILFR